MKTIRLHTQVIVAAFLAGVLILIPVLPLSAQEYTAIEVPNFGSDSGDNGLIIGGSDTAMPANTVSCFDYYRFGSVKADLTAQVASAVAGVPITFSGTITNENAYPIVDGALFVKIFKSRGAVNDGNGPDVVDQFFVTSDTVIPANGSVPISFQWRIPAHAQTGEYELATFFTTSHKFNLLGLSFTDDVTGTTVPFGVVGERTTGVAFDKSSVTVNDQPYLFATFPPRVGPRDPASVTARITNTTDTPETAVVSWVVYQWDAQLRENAVTEETRQIEVPARGSAPLSITVRDTKYPVYLVVGILKWKDTQSVINVRFGRDGIERTRINFPGVASFPLRADEENTVFSCLHNSGDGDVVPDGRLELTLSDAAGNTIHEYTYTGGVTGTMMGVAEKFVTEKSYDYFVLDARLYSNGEFIDEAHLIYDCQVIDSNLCSDEQRVDSLQLFRDSTLLSAIAATAIVVLIALVFVYRRITRRPASERNIAATRMH